MSAIQLSDVPAAEARSAVPEPPWRESASGSGLPIGPRRWAAGAIWLALLMAVLDASIANVALPTIARNLHTEAAASIWIVNAYQLAIVVSLLPLAALGEIVTFRRVFLAGLSLFVVASVGCALARTLPELALARAAQGFGAAGIMSVNGALVRFIFPPAQLGRGVGRNALVIALSAAIGPSVASAILAVASWPWLFAINVPTGLAALIVGYWALPATPRAARRLDPASVALNVAAFGMTIAGIDALTHGGSRWIGGATMAAGIVAAHLLLVRSRTLPHPLLPIDLLRNRLFALTALTSVASFAAAMLAFIALPFLLQNGMHRSQAETGLLITAWPVSVAIAAPFAGRLADRYSAAILGAVGLAMLATGLLLLGTAPATASAAEVVWCVIFCGLGFGLFQSPNNRTLLNSAPKARAGAAGGMLAVARVTGQITGATLAAILFRTVPDGANWGLRMGAAVAVAAAVVSMGRLLKAAATRPSAI